MPGKLTISIDLELAWGWWDILTPEILHLAETADRPICDRLIELFERYQIPATWAMVAALLDEPSARTRPGNLRAWHAPDIIERIIKAKTAHEVGSHGGRHIYFNTIPAADAQADLDFAKEVHRAHGLAFESFVFPRNAVGHLDLLARAGLRVFRCSDTGWTRGAANAPSIVRKLVNFGDRLLPIPPAPAWAQQRGGLIDIPGSMLLSGREGVRRFILPQVTRSKLSLGLERARRTGGTFHFWFHPSNFYQRRDEQFTTLEWFLARAADEAGRGRIEICTMGAYACSGRGAKAAA